MKETKIFYVDGSCSGNPGPGGWAAVHLSVEKDTEYVADYARQTVEQTTNNRMEMSAMLYVLKLAAEDPDNIYEMYSDSAYVVNMCNDWIWKWAKNSWIKSSKKQPVENLDLVKQIYECLNQDNINVKIYKVKGHEGTLGNELADSIASGNFKKFNQLIKENNITWNLCKEFF